MAYQVFISYRRADTEALASWINNDLSLALGDDAVFFDHTEIQPGDIFPNRIKEAIADAPVFIALIGGAWNPATPEGLHRLDQAHDYVRQEIELALTHTESDSDRIVIPVLDDSVAMPQESELPECLHGLCLKNAHPLRSQAYSQGIQDVCTLICRHLEKLDRTPHEERWILQLINSVLPDSRAQIEQYGNALTQRFPEIAKKPTSRRELASTLYAIGPRSLECLVPLTEKSSALAHLVDLLATNWITPASAGVLRESLLNPQDEQAVSIDCEYEEFTPKETLLKASQESRGWPTTFVKSSDENIEILEQLTADLREEFEDPLSAVRRKYQGQVNHAGTPYSDRELINIVLDGRAKVSGAPLPWVINLSHFAALDADLIGLIQSTFPNIRIVIATNNPDEIKDAIDAVRIVQPYDDDDAEESAFNEYYEAKRNIRKLRP